MNIKEIKIYDRQLMAMNNKPIRKATAVQFPCGFFVQFTEKMTKKRAFNQAFEMYMKEKGRFICQSH